MKRKIFITSYQHQVGPVDESDPFAILLQTCSYHYIIKFKTIVWDFTTVFDTVGCAFFVTRVVTKQLRKLIQVNTHNKLIIQANLHQPKEDEKKILSQTLSLWTSRLYATIFSLALADFQEFVLTLLVFI